MFGATNMAIDYDVFERVSENGRTNHHCHHHQDSVEEKPGVTDIIIDTSTNDLTENPNNDTADVSHDGQENTTDENKNSDNFEKMTEKNIKSESNEFGSGMHVGTPTKLKLDPKDPLRPRRKKARRACFACQRAHLTCGDERPCQRCIKRGLADACQDGIRKKAKYLHDAPPESLRPVLGPYYKPNFNQKNNHRRSVSGNGHSMTRDSSDASPPSNSARMSSLFSIEGTPSYPVFNQSNSLQPPLQARLPMDGQQTPTTPSFNPHSSVQGISLPPQVTSNDHQRETFSKANILFDSGNPSPYSFDLEGLNFDNHYGALEFGILGHISSGADKMSLKEQSESVFMQDFVQISPNDNSIYGNGIASCNQEYQNDFINYGNVPENHIFLSQGLPNAYTIATGSQSQYSPSTEAISRLNGAYENSPTATTFTPANTPHMPTPKSLKTSKSRTAGKSSRSTFGSNLLKKRNRDSSLVYDMVQEPYPYTAGFHNLTAFLQRRFSPTATLRIAKSLASIRPSFISCMKTLTRQDLIFMEKCFQRTLFEYEDFMCNCCTPTIVCRRTGEITAVNQEFSMMTGWSKDVLLGRELNLNVNTGTSELSSGINVSKDERTSTFSDPRMAHLEVNNYSSNNNNNNNSNNKGNDDGNSNHDDIPIKNVPVQQQAVLLAELMDADNVVEFFQDFARLAFDDSRGSVTRRCKLLKYLPREKVVSSNRNQDPDAPKKSMTKITTTDIQGQDLSNYDTMAISNGQGKKDSIPGSIDGGENSSHDFQGPSDDKKSSSGSTIGNFERDGKFDCCYCWTVKRDVFDIPMMIIMNSI